MLPPSLLVSTQVCVACPELAGVCCAAPCDVHALRRFPDFLRPDRPSAAERRAAKLAPVAALLSVAAVAVLLVRVRRASNAPRSSIAPRRRRDRDPHWYPRGRSPRRAPALTEARG